MRIKGRHYQTIWLENKDCVRTIDQRVLPYKFSIVDIKSSEGIYRAIKDMTVRGAPLIGITGGYGIYLASLEAERNNLKCAKDYIVNTANKNKKGKTYSGKSILGY